MIFEWDEAKSRDNEQLRALPFGVAIAMFDGPTVELVDDRRAYGEVRVRAVGMVADVCLVCVYTDRGAIRRLISLRRANRKERDEYRSTISR